MEFLQEGLEIFPTSIFHLPPFFMNRPPVEFVCVTQNSTRRSVDLFIFAFPEIQG
jgi:hypothetical protein